MANILIIDDNTAIQILLKRTFEAEGHTVTLGGSREELFHLLKINTYDLLYLDVNLPDGRSDVDLSQILNLDPLLDVIIITGETCLEQATKLLKQGASAYMMKPFHKDSISQSALKILKDRRIKLESRARSSNPLFETPKKRLMGVSHQICRLNLLLQRIAKSPSAPVLLVGESGTGKELAAQIIHENSPRNGKPFIKANCPAIPHHLMESELFGLEHPTGNGDVRIRKGLLEIANGGSILIDEISSLHPDVQAKLETFIKEGTYRRVGSKTDRKVDVRVLSSTNKDLLKIAEETEQFHLSLYRQLSVMNITMPSLRHHKEDIEVLATATLREKSEELGRGFMQFSTNVLDFLYQYSWPCNVRELRNMVERLIILSETNIINLNQDILRSLTYTPTRSPSSSSYFYIGGTDLQEQSNSPEIKRAEKKDPKRQETSNNVKPAITSLWELEKTAILNALNTTSTPSECAQQLGISEQSLQNKMQKYNLINATEK
ncbi:MAG: sigma-54-dependent transcriptional regulator [Sumerlaeia bacterium]